MALLPIFILALVQGITEFLPISSSGHLILVHAAFGGNATPGSVWQDHMLLDIAVHIGTLFSVILYFRNDIYKMCAGVKDIARKDVHAEGSRLIFNLLVGSIPVMIAGYGLHLWQPEWLLQVEIVAWTTIIFGILLWFADRTPECTRTVNDMGLKHALIIGTTQAFALVPGTSRSGITMTSARFLGYSRAESAHFSLLLAIVAISGAGALSVSELIQTGNMEIGFDFLLAVVLSFITGLGAIILMMKWLERATFMPFVIYRLIMGVVLLGLIYGGVISS